MKNVLDGKRIKVIYLDVEDIAGAVDAIRKERADADGNELWFPLMVRYLEESPYGKRYAPVGFGGVAWPFGEKKSFGASYSWKGFRGSGKDCKG